MTSFVYDVGALVAADRNDRKFWADHRVRLELGVVPLVPAPVVAQVSRSPRQAQLRRLLAGCDVRSFSESDAHRAGALLARSGTCDVTDAAVALLAEGGAATIVTSDPTDLARLVRATRRAAEIVEV